MIQSHRKVKAIPVCIRGPDIKLRVLARALKPPLLAGPSVFDVRGQGCSLSLSIAGISADGRPMMRRVGMSWEVMVSAKYDVDGPEQMALLLICRSHAPTSLKLHRRVLLYAPLLRAQQVDFELDESVCAIVMVVNWLWARHRVKAFYRGSIFAPDPGRSYVSFGSPRMPRESSEARLNMSIVLLTIFATIPAMLPCLRSTSPISS